MFFDCNKMTSTLIARFDLVQEDSSGRKVISKLRHL